MLIIPAAGLGTRLRSALPKLMVPVCGRPMIDWVMDLYRAYVSQIIVVAHPTFESMVREHLASRDLPPVTVVLQDAPTGMLDAILVPHALLAASGAGPIWITWCDQAGIRPGTVQRLAEECAAHPAAAAVLPTCQRAEPYIHFERDAAGTIVRVLQRREGDAMPLDGESDAGLFSLSRAAYLHELPSYAATGRVGARTGERNFLPFLPWIAPRAAVVTYPCEAREGVGINTPEELRYLEGVLRSRSGLA